MQSENKRNTQFMIAKQVFIAHNLGEIEQDYEINQNCLGQGGFGAVFEGRKRQKMEQQNNQDKMGMSFSSYETCSRSGSDQQNCNESRAIKRICYKRTEDKELMKNEIQILSYLDHPLVVKLYETYQHKKELYLVIDLLKGGDLFTVINENDKMSESQAKVVFLQLIKAISYLHAQHISHRDLKLQNIIFVDSDSYNLKIVDFGLAFCWDENMKKELRQKGLHKKTTGTPDYMSPEMLAQNYDQRCDIWSAGVILYMLLSGSSPFQGQTQKEIIQKIKSFDFSFQIPEFNNVSENAKDLIEKILKPEDERATLKEILEHPWLSEASFGSNVSSENCSVSLVCPTNKIDSISTDLDKMSRASGQSHQLKRKSSEVTEDGNEVDFICKSQCSDVLPHLERPQQLTLKKLEHYHKLSKLQKLQAIFSVSQLSESRIKTYGQQFLLIDNDNDGTISLEDLETYLSEFEIVMSKEEIETYFNDVALAQRDCISYSEYLACVLSYETDLIPIFTTEILQFDESERSLENSKLSELSGDNLMERVDIYEDSMIMDFFSLLDRNKDGFITKKDFLHLLEENGIKSQNHALIEQLSIKLHEKSTSQSSAKYIKKQTNDEWFVDPRKYKWQLSRTYKGESDGGMMINFRQFKHLMTGSQWCSK